jgi:dTMP kinase
MKGLFITLEGGEGGGKSTQADLLINWMKERNIPCALTKEPGCPEIIECVKMRKLLLDPNNNLTDRSELLLFLADRAQHVDQFIRPNLEKGVNVVCDRYSDSTRVYQSARKGLGLGRQKIDTMLDIATNELDPDLTFILDVPVEIGLERAKAKSIYKDGDRMEKAGIRFHEDVRHGFLKLAENVMERRFRVINAAPPKEIKDIHEEIVTAVSKKMWAEETLEVGNA